MEEIILTQMIGRNSWSTSQAFQCYYKLETFTAASTSDTSFSILLLETIALFHNRILDLKNDRYESREVPSSLLLYTINHKFYISWRKRYLCFRSRNRLSLAIDWFIRTIVEVPNALLVSFYSFSNQNRNVYDTNSLLVESWNPTRQHYGTVFVPEYCEMIPYV